MKKETLEIDGNTYIISELKYKDVVELADLNKSDSAKKLMQLSVGLSDEEYNELGMSVGMKIMNAVNSLNNIDSENFPTPTQNK